MSSGAKFIQFLIGLQWVYISCCFVNIAHAAPLNDQVWQAIAPGIDYQVLSYMLTPWSRIHVFRLHLKQHPLKLVRAKALGRDQAFVRDLAQYAQARLAINGGFFDQAFRPLGLRVAQGQPYSALRSISWWGVFYVRHGRAAIKRARDVPSVDSMQFGVQSGPRLLVAGNIPLLKPGRDERTALGITQTGEVLWVVTENMPLTTTELAEIMKAPPISAWDALNLDGGSSTQFYANFTTLKLDKHNAAMVADAVIVA